MDLTKGSIWQLLRKVTIPASTGSLFQTFYNLVDTYFAEEFLQKRCGNSKIMANLFYSDSRGGWYWSWDYGSNKQLYWSKKKIGRLLCTLLSQ